MAHTAYFKDVFVHDVKAVPGKLISLDFCDPLDTTGPEYTAAEMLEDDMSQQAFRHGPQ